MRHAGFVLTGGRSRRMGRDKAVLPYGGRTLLEHIAGQVLEAAGKVSLIGSPERYGRFGYPAHRDLMEGCGPLGGIYTALKLQQADWNLVVACDLPRIPLDRLAHILEVASSSDQTSDCVIPFSGEGKAEPLCAVYHSRCQLKIELALREKRFKVRDLLLELVVVPYHGISPELFANVNTAADWEEIEEWQR